MAREKQEGQSENSYINLVQAQWRLRPECYGGGGEK